MVISQINPLPTDSLPQRTKNSNTDFQLELILDVNTTKMLLGEFDQNVRILEEILPVKLAIRSTKWVFKGEEQSVKNSVSYINKLVESLKLGVSLDPQLMHRLWKDLQAHTAEEVMETFTKEIVKTSNKIIRPKTKNQLDYINSIEDSVLTFGVGPAGTGKTFLAIAEAVKALKAGEVKRVILTRPAVEAGERLGFLPGNLFEKIDPYLRPLLDALNDLLTAKVTTELLESGVIEVIPLAFMRGRTLNDAFIILDEAQNTTNEQMKMFLTRLGLNSKMVITGDTSQIDLPKETKSGLIKAINILKSVAGIEFIFFNEQDIVRHSLVTKIVRAYENQK